MASEPKKLVPGNQLDLSPQKLAARLTGNKDTAVHKRGIERDDAQLQFYCDEPHGWPEVNSVRVPQVCWSGLPIPLHQANLHFLIAGVPGTGKTLSFRMLLQSIFAERVQKHLGGNDRAVIYDPKQEFYPILRGFGLAKERLVILNPFDARCHAWNLAEDYTCPADAYQLAKTMIPCPEGHHQPFFPKAAAAILTGVITALMHKNKHGWSLADIILNCLNEKLMTDLLTSVPANPYIEMAMSSLGSGDTRANVLAELTSHLFEFMPIAVRWRSARKAGRSISIKNFVKSSDMTILLGANQTYSHSIQVMNRLFLKRLGEVTMDTVADGQWKAKNRTWVILDELRELGKVPGLSDFINKGRSRGVCAVLGFQDYLGLKEAFGENGAHEITAICAHRLFLKLGGESAEWASKSIGKSEILDTNFSLSTGTSIAISGQTGKSTTNTWGPVGSYAVTRSDSSGFNLTLSSNVTTSQVTRETDAVLPSEISGLPAFEEGGGITGFVCGRFDEGKPVVRKLHYPAYLLQGLLNETDEPGFVSWEPDGLEW